MIMSRSYVVHAWLIQNFGCSTGYKPIDQNQEHNIRDEKARFNARSSGNSWEYIGRTSPAIPTLRAVVDYVQFHVNPFARYKKHQSPDAEDDIQLLVQYYQTHRMHVRRHRKMSKKEKSVDYLRQGAEHTRLTNVITRWLERRKGDISTEQVWDGVLDVPQS
jgi:hypothetical protein